MNDLNKELKKLLEQKESLVSRIREVNQSLWDKMIQDRSYTTDLSPYNGCNLESITGINSEGKRVYLPTDEMVRVEDGKLDCSSYNSGLVSWDKRRESYFSCFWGVEEDLDLIGFTEIVVEEED